MEPKKKSKKRPQKQLPLFPEDGNQEAITVCENIIEKETNPYLLQFYAEIREGLIKKREEENEN